MSAPTHRLAKLYADGHPLETARRLERSDPAAAAVFLASLDAAAAARVLRHMVSRLGAAVLEHTDSPRAVEMLGTLPEWEQVRLVRHVGKEHLPALLEAFPGGRRDEIRALVGYPAGSVGSVADRQAAVLPEDLSVGDALGAVADSPIPYLYVVDRSHHLAGVVHQRRLLTSDPSAELRAVMNRNVIRIPARTPIPVALHHSAWRELDALPVVDRAGRLVGDVRRKNLVSSVERPQPEPGRPSLVGALLDLGGLYWGGLISLLVGLPTPAAEPKEGGG